ncbi:hypothetical protein DLM78_06745 [Leptospira stimsonii]|uniref:Uncharacterized protein n=1 Tax=Leptospira stimsonii TaxID=2202203 RepID=A0A8B3CTN4_9LEPT|nr:hypothetical protein DLM78_06745 [Leptospira stimsonii]
MTELHEPVLEKFLRARTGQTSVRLQVFFRGTFCRTDRIREECMGLSSDFSFLEKSRNSHFF